MHPHSLHRSTARFGPVLCPSCRQPAEVVDGFSLGATDGPYLHLKVTCHGGHWYTLPADGVHAHGAQPIDLAA
jgi:hypothetical protein